MQITQSITRTPVPFRRYSPSNIHGGWRPCTVLQVTRRLVTIAVEPPKGPDHEWDDPDTRTLSITDFWRLYDGQ